MKEFQQTFIFKIQKLIIKTYSVNFVSMNKRQREREREKEI